MPDSPHILNLDQVRIDVATADDHPSIIRLYEEGVLERQTHGNDTGADIDNVQEAYFSDDGASSLWTARYDDEVIGMIGVQRAASNAAEVRRLRVDSRFRRKGVGTKLMAQALGFCQEKGYLKVVLDVRIERAPAIALFEKFGFLHARTRDIDGRKLVDFYVDLYRQQHGHHL
ncbi:MAG: GNAT family N-acetyltransferase [Planctomycetota bacterium]